MPRKSRKKGQRFRYTAPTGQTFTIVDRGSRGWQLEVTLPGFGRVRELLGEGSREAATRKAIARLGEFAKDTSPNNDSPALSRVGAELILAKTKEGKASSYTRHIEGHLRNYILPHYGHDTAIGAIPSREHARFKHLLESGGRCIFAMMRHDAP